MLSSVKKEEPKKRGKYGRPCDRCASRRIRCVMSGDNKSCIGCLNNKVQCTQNRVRHKSGPKFSKKNRPEQLSQTKSVPELPLSTIPTLPQNVDLITTLPTFNMMGSSVNMKQNITPCLTPTVPSTVEFDFATPLDNTRPDMKNNIKSEVEPPSLHVNLEDILDVFQNTTIHLSKFSVEHLLPRLQVYQTWFYGSWPVLSVAELILNILDGAQMRYEKNTIRLTEQNAMLYALCCSVCAAITTQISFVSDKDTVLDYNTFSASEYADEARRVRNLFDFNTNPNVQTLLSSFFLYAHYVNNKGRTLQAIMYLREAITIAQILGFHEESSYVGKTRAEVHRWRKIYYTLLVTERFMCFEDGMPVVLEPCIAFPNLDDEEYPSLLMGFTELIKVFSVPSKEFFAEMCLKGSKKQMDTQPIIEKKARILLVQEKLWNITLGIKKIANSQKLDVLLSRSWIRALAWHITSEAGLVVAGGNSNDCFDVEFPVTIARDFLAQTSDLPMFAFEANGPGVCIKLLEIATSVTHSIQKEHAPIPTLNVLESLWQIITKCENDVTLPVDMYQKVGNIVSYFKTKTIPRLMQPTNNFRGSYIEEIVEDLDGEDADNANMDPCVDYAPPSRVETPMLKVFGLSQGYENMEVGLTGTPLTEFKEMADSYTLAMTDLRRSGKVSANSSNVSLNNMMNLFMSRTPQGQDKCGGSLEEFLADITGKSGNCMTSET